MNGGEGSLDDDVYFLGHAHLNDYDWDTIAMIRTTQHKDDPEATVEILKTSYQEKLKNIGIRIQQELARFEPELNQLQLKYDNFKKILKLTEEDKYKRGMAALEQWRK